MRLLSLCRLQEQSTGALPQATRFLVSWRIAPFLLMCVLLGAFSSGHNAMAQGPNNPAAVILTPINDRNSESDTLGTRPGPLPSFQVRLRSEDEGGIAPSNNVLVTLRVDNQPAAGTTPDNDPEVLIATVAQPAFRRRQTLLFTPQAYTEVQEVRVQGQNGILEDGDQPFRVFVESVRSADVRYENLGSQATGGTGIGQFVLGVNTDNDVTPAPNTAAIRIVNLGSNPSDPNVTLNPIVTNENGAQQSVSVVLTKAPTADVDIIFQTSDPTEGLIRRADGSLAEQIVLTFSPDSGSQFAWNVPQTVTIQGVEDPEGAIVDGNIGYRIITTVADTTLDSDYAAIDPPDIIATNNDNEIFGLTLSLSFVVVFEGQTATINAVLNRAPTQPVRFRLQARVPSTGSPNTWPVSNEVILSQSELVFAPETFNVPQQIAITGISDNIVDGDKPFAIVAENALSSDPNYNNRFGTVVNGTVVDVDQAFVRIQPPGGLETSEGGRVATFQVSLGSKPQAGQQVRINLASSNTAEGRVTPSTLTFTAADWNTPKTVTITGVDDPFADGDQSYRIDLTIEQDAAGGTLFDNDYERIQLLPVTVINRDDGDAIGLVVTPSSGLRTREDATTTATVRVHLSFQPTANVTVPVRSNNLNEGVVTPSRLTFTPSNFATPQVLTITGVNDFIDDGDQQYQIIFDRLISTDPNYRFDPADLTVTNEDEDVAGVSVTRPDRSPPVGLETTEAGGTDVFNVRLATQPTSNVTLNLSTRAETEVSFSPSSIVFTPGEPPAGSPANVVNWNRGVRVTVTGLDDTVKDGDIPWTIITQPLVSNDPKYNGLNPVNVSGVNRDNEEAGIFFNPPILVTTEGESTQFSAFLTVKPAFDVRFTLSVSAGDEDEVRLSQNVLLFTPSNFNQPQSITITGLRDFVRDGDQPFEVIVSGAVSSDPVYNRNFGRVVEGTNIDVDAPGIVVNAAARLETTELGGTDTFTVALATRPAAGTTVTVRATSSDTTEGRVAPATLTFNESNFNVPQTVTVRGVDDALEDFDQSYRILLAVDNTVVGSDPDYASVTVNPVNAVNRDNEKPGVTVTPSSELRTTEARPETTTFAVTLNGPPTSNVQVVLRSTNTKEGRLIDPATGQVDADNSLTLTFTAANFNQAQTITVQGMDDAFADGDISYRVDFRVVSNDARYNDLKVPSVLLVNVDNDQAGVDITPITGLSVSESGSNTFTVRLRSQPRGDVTMSLTNQTPSQVTINVTSITFSPGAPTQANTGTQRFTRWDRPVTVTVRGVRDQIRDGNQPFVIETGALVSTDATYNGLNPANVRGTAIDVDVPAIGVRPASTGIRTSEAGTTSFFRVRLATRPAADVTIPLRVIDTTEARLDQSQLVFTTANWNIEQRVIVTGVDDTIEDGPVTYQIVIGKPVSADRNYSALAAVNLDGINADNDDKTPPTVAITTPANNAFLTSLATISGTAADQPSATNPDLGIVSGIKRVEVRLSRFDDPRTTTVNEAGFYNRSTGVFDRTFNAAAHVIPANYDATTGQWTLTIPALKGTPPTLPSGRYSVRATAIDNADAAAGNTSNVGTSAIVNFTVDTQAPPQNQVLIIQPAQDAVYTTLAEVRGVARDDVAGSGIKAVRLLVFRAANAATGTTNGYLQDDGTFVPSRPAELVTLGEANATGGFNFTYVFSPPLQPGRYFVQAVAEDQAGNKTLSERIFFTMRNAASGPDDFLVGQTYLISLPYMDSSTITATSTPDEVFNVPMIDAATGNRNYQLNRFNAETQTYELLGPGDALRRGEGYFIRPLTANVRILRPGDDPTRVPMARSISAFVVTLRRNPSANPQDQNNGFNLIGNPFNPENYLAADWTNATVQYNGVTYGSVIEAAAAGIVDSRLFTYDASTNGYQPVEGNMEPFRGYFVKTFYDGVKVTLKGISSLP